MRIYSVYFFVIFQSMNLHFTALNDGLVSAIISILRTLGFQLLCIIILPMILGIDGICWAMLIYNDYYLLDI